MNYTAGPNDIGVRLDRFISKTNKELSSSLIQKLIRTGKVKINGKKAAANYRLKENDQIVLYQVIKNQSVSDAQDWDPSINPQLDLLYEDENIILINKPKGVLSQPDKASSYTSLSSLIKSYLFHKGEWNPEDENTFAPALCNRIDRNTNGIVIAAKNAAALRIITEKIKLREIHKSYLCIISGTMQPKEGILYHFLRKNSKTNQVDVFDHTVPGGLTAKLTYRTLKSSKNISLVECHLITGRTHQIRAQFSHMHHPLIGDGKYGREKINNYYKQHSQLLFSYQLTFQFQSDAGPMNYLNGKTFALDTSEFEDLYIRMASDDKK